MTPIPSSARSIGTSGKTAALVLLMAAAGLLSGCQTDGAPSNPVAELANYAAKKSAPDKPAEPEMTRTRAAQECWMSTEGKAIDANLDKRADFVTKCIEKKMKAADAAPAPKS